VFRGDIPLEFVLFLPGGRVEGKTTIVVGAPVFKVGQEVVLFLSKMTQPRDDLKLFDNEASYRLTDLFQGAFNVVVDPATKELMVVSNVINLVDQPELRPDILGRLKGLPLAELETRVRQAP